MKIKEMIFSEAAEAMYQDKKVKRPMWSGFWVLDKSKGIGCYRIKDELNRDIKVGWYNSTATDWMIVEDKKETLSDRIVEYAGGKALDPEYVKQYIKKFDIWISTEGFNYDDIKKKLKELFGEKNEN